MQRHTDLLYIKLLLRKWPFHPCTSPQNTNDFFAEPVTNNPSQTGVNRDLKPKITKKKRIKRQGQFSAQSFYCFK